jgi:hypothetical protein
LRFVVGRIEPSFNIVVNTGVVAGIVINCDWVSTKNSFKWFYL